MQLIRGQHNLSSQHRGCAVTIGAFDGVHLGHQAVLAHLKRQALRLEIPTTVVTFEPLPREYLTPLEAPPRITTLRDKWPLLEACGVDRVLCLPFNERLRQLTARQFVEQIFVDGLGAQYLAFGDDFHFGNQREGDLEYVRALSDEFGYAVAPTATLEAAGERVSSTRIRAAFMLSACREAVSRARRVWLTWVSNPPLVSVWRQPSRCMFWKAHRTFMVRD
jgi:riboflavin kinase/FMN adenylyltransferase